MIFKRLESYALDIESCDPIIAYLNFIMLQSHLNCAKVGYFSASARLSGGLLMLVLVLMGIQ